MTTTHRPSGSNRDPADGAVDARNSIAIFTSREPIQVLLRCLRATIAACEGLDATVDVMVNGNRALAEEVARHVEFLSAPPATFDFRIWFIPLGDKAHAWNVYLNSIWTPSCVTFFIDGYVEVRTDALGAMRRALVAIPEALAASGVPTAGRSARDLRRRMSREGGIHGNLYALRGSAMSALKARGFRLPLGIYRTDPLLGAVLAFNLDPRIHEWDTKRIVAVPQALWHFEPLSLFRVKDLVTQLRRMLRQAQGILENRAIRWHLAILKRMPEELPATAVALVNQWAAENRNEAVRVFVTHPLSVWALRQMRRPRDWSAAKHPALLMANTRAPGLSQSPPGSVVELGRAN